MTDVRFVFDPGPVVVEVSPYARHVVGDTVHFPDPRVERSNTSTLTLAMPPGYWRIKEKCTGGKNRLVLVPDSSTSVDFTELADVDPATLAPSAAPLPAWQVALQQLADAVAAIVPGAGPGTSTPAPVPYEQPDPSSVWAFAHQLGYRPGGVVVLDGDGNQVVPMIGYPTASTITLTFAYPVSGTAYLS